MPQTQMMSGWPTAPFPNVRCGYSEILLLSGYMPTPCSEGCPNSDQVCTGQIQLIPPGGYCACDKEKGYVRVPKYRHCVRSFVCARLYPKPNATSAPIANPRAQGVPADTPFIPMAGQGASVFPVPIPVEAQLNPTAGQTAPEIPENTPHIRTAGQAVLGGPVNTPFTQISGQSNLIVSGPLAAPIGATPIDASLLASNQPTLVV